MTVVTAGRGNLSKGKFRKRRIRKPRTVKALDRKVNKIAKKIMKAPERKYHDVAPEFTGLDSAQVPAVSLSEINTGNTAITRQGLDIRPKYLVVRGTLFRSATANQLSDICRVVVVQDLRQAEDGSFPTYDDVFQNPSWQAHMNYPNKGRFRILYDKVFELDENNPSQTFKAVITRLSPIRYIDNVTGNVNKNGIYMLAIGSDNSAETDGPTLYANCRLVFTDS